MCNTKCVIRQECDSFYRQFDDETAAGMIVGIEFHGAAKVLDMTADEWQTKSETFGEVVDLGEHPEETAGILLGDAWACILDHETDIIMRTADA